MGGSDYTMPLTLPSFLNLVVHAARAVYLRCVPFCRPTPRALCHGSFARVRKQTGAVVNQV